MTSDVLTTAIEELEPKIAPTAPVIYDDGGRYDPPEMIVEG